jgi:hypothetical protein
MPGKIQAISQGGVVEPWAAELSPAWKRACDSLGGRKLVLDLIGLT